MSLRRLSLLCLTVFVSATPSFADGPLPKSEERTRFHPRAVPMPAAKRLAGYGERLRAEGDSPLASLRFRSVGPEVQGGRIVDIEGPAERPDTLLVAFASGGLFRTDDRGGSWTPLFDRESSLTLGDLALGDALGDVLWAGTGESNSSRTSYAGTGVFKSTDAGKTWRNTGLHDSHHIGRILVHPTRPDTVWVAALGPLYTVGGDRGVFKTTDGGGSWRRVLAVDEKTGAADLAFDPKAPDVLYAAMWERDRKPWNFLESGPGSGVFKSTDGGETWTKLGGGLPGGDTLGRVGLAVAESRPGSVYAVVDNQARRPPGAPLDDETPPGELTPKRLGRLTREQLADLDPAVVARFLSGYGFPKELKARALQKDVLAGKVTIKDLVDYVADADRAMTESEIVGLEVYRSDDAGASWRRTHEKPLEKVVYTYGYYFGRIWAAPDDADRVYVAGVPLVGSTDGGRTWRGLDRTGVHGDHHALFFEAGASRRVALGTDGGLNLSWDGGTTWKKVNNLPVGQFTTIAVDDAEPYNILGGLQDNGVLRGPSSHVPGKSDPSQWKPIYGGDGSWVEVDPKDRNLVYTASQFGAASRLDLKAGTRERIRPRPALKEKPLRFNWVTPFVLSPHTRHILYFGANRLHRSFDRGDTWTAVSPDLTSSREQGDVPFGTITTISESPKRFGLLYCGTDEGKVWGSTDAGATWKDLSKGLAPDRWVTRVVASAHDEKTVYVTQSGYRHDEFTPYVWRSTDSGATWSSLAKGLPLEPVNTVREDPKASHLLYLGTDLGAFVSLDRGESFLPFTGGLPHVAVHDLAVQPREGDVVLGTHGRSVLVAEAAPLRELTAAVQKKPLHAFKVKSVESDRWRGYGENPWFSWFRVPPARTIAWWSAAAGPVAVRVKDAWGNVLRELTAAGVKGFNALEYDLGADRDKADFAEAAQLAREREEAASRGELKKRFTPPKAGEAEGDDDEAETRSDGPKPAPPEVAELLADPLRATRPRYLTPGRYTIEVVQGSETATTTLRVKRPKKEAGPEGDD